MDEEGIPVIFNGKFDNKIKGKSIKLWEKVVQRDTLHILGILGWRRRAAGKEELNRLLREVRAQKGP
jgi:hypothetical protein